MSRSIALTRSDAESVLEGRSARLDALRGQHLFISGGTGILGSWLLELTKVLNERHGFALRVTVLSRRAKKFVESYPHLGSQKGVSFVEGDIRHFTEFPRDINYVIHAAALTDRRFIASNPSAVAEVCGVGALRVLKAATLLEDLRKMVLMSSGLVCGTQPLNMSRVDETFVGPVRCNDVNAAYVEAKRFAEVLSHSVISESKLPLVTLRPFAFVGPYQSMQLPWAVTDFMRDSFTGGPIRMMGDGSTVRSLMYASDYAFWVLAALVHGIPRETYNVGSPEPVDLATLARMITQSFSPVPEIHTQLGQSGHERTRLVPDVSRAMRDLGVELTVSLADAIQRTITWHRLKQLS